MSGIVFALLTDMLRNAGNAWPTPPRLGNEQDATWSFCRGSHKLEIRASETALGFLVTITVDGSPESNAFRDAWRAARFRSQMETALLEHGWTLMAFSPNRRFRNDRRAATRDAERRLSSLADKGSLTVD
jgi:hypothetical protein